MCNIYSKCATYGKTPWNNGLSNAFRSLLILTEISHDSSREVYWLAVVSRLSSHLACEWTTRNVHGK